MLELIIFWFLFSIAVVLCGYFYLQSEKHKESSEFWRKSYYDLLQGKSEPASKKISKERKAS